ncbi:MAG TPA: hypothetical protein VK689_13115 [Armatimonadota bacterium]|nr:hypothetical protein [Armatimonadota bacterium]
MKYRTILLSAVLAGSTALFAAPPAQAIGFGVGIFGRLGNSGIYPSIGYRGGRYGRGVDVGVQVDAGQYTRRRRDRDRRDEEIRDRRAENVSLKVSPRDTWVYLNGILVEEDGRSEITLPEGRHRLEFVREGYRTEVAELDVQSGIDYRIERKLSRLQREEANDRRVDDGARPVSVEEALRLTNRARSPRTPATTDRPTRTPERERETPERDR